MKNTGVLIPVLDERIELAKRSIISAVLNDFGEIIIIGSNKIKLLQELHENIIFVKNTGRTAERYNAGLNRLTCEYTMFLNDDDFYLKIPDVYHSNANFIYSDFYILRGGEITRFIGRPKILREVNYIGYLTVRIRTDILRDNKFDEELNYMEDYELWLRLQRKGLDFKYYPLAFAVSDQDSSPSRKSNNTDYNQTLETIQKRYNNINTPDYWNRKWDYDRLRYRKHYDLFDDIVKLIPKNSKVVDLGCGTGTLLNKIKNEVKNVDATGVDFSYIALNMLRDDIHKVKCVLPETKFKNKSFDVAIATELLEHLDDDEKMIEEMRRIAKKVIVTVPNNFLPPEVEPEHLRTYTKESLNKILKGEVIEKGNYLLGVWNDKE